MQEIEEKFMIASSESTHLIMKMEKLFSTKKIACRIIPLPTEISAECGLAIRFESEDKNRVLKLIEEVEEKINIYCVEKKGFKKKIEKILL